MSMFPKVNYRKLSTTKHIHDEGPLTSDAAPAPVMNLQYLDRFLRWDCCADLLHMGLFPNSKEITESMACLEVLDKVLKLKLSDESTLCIVVGDGTVPRTAALLAMRTKWRRIFSVDPDLAGLPLSSCQVASQAKERQFKPRNAAGRQAHQAAFDARRARLRARHAKIAEVERLHLIPFPVEKVDITVDTSLDKHVVMLLPHAHVVPENALKALRFTRDVDVEDGIPTISLVQFPCCKYVRYNTVWGRPPDLDFTDECILSDKRSVRVWYDVAEAGMQVKAFDHVV